MIALTSNITLIKACDSTTTIADVHNSNITLTVMLSSAIIL